MILPMRSTSILTASALSAGLAIVAFSPSALDALQNRGAAPASSPAPLALPQERHLANVKQLTFGGENAEAYFSFDGQWLSFQSTRDGRGCDQIYVMRTDGRDARMISTG